jgi:hypothetical protein
MTTQPKKQKLYCYVDETGQDTKGDFFIVSVVVAEDHRDSLITMLERIEKTTGKGRVKWNGAKDDARAAYITRVLTTPAFKGTLSYALYHHTTDYLSRTVLTAARAITAHARGNYHATVFVDGLPKSKTKWFGTELRHLHIRTKKVRGVRKEEADALIRLADALCGFVRAALSKGDDFMVLLEKAKHEGYIREL